MRWMKKALFRLKCNTYRCTHIQRDVTTTYYPKSNPNHKKGIKCELLNPKPNSEDYIRPKRRRIAALGLRLGLLA